jgi:hypothetical protein
MTLEPQAFMSKICQRVGFTNEDKALLKSQADWGEKIASEMADHF